MIESEALPSSLEQNLRQYIFLSILTKIEKKKFMLGSLQEKSLFYYLVLKENVSTLLYEKY